MTDVNTPEEPLTEDPRPDGLRVAKSLVLVHTGDGKGKSSAAFGIAMRARARDWPVAVIQFLKSDEVGDWRAIDGRHPGYRFSVAWRWLHLGQR